MYRGDMVKTDTNPCCYEIIITQLSLLNFEFWQYLNYTDIYKSICHPFFFLFMSVNLVQTLLA